MKSAAQSYKLERETRLEPSPQPFDLKGLSASAVWTTDAIMDLFKEPGNPLANFFFYVCPPGPALFSAAPAIATE
ncbi:hypothetical protein GFL09_16670 [Pseudomonas stutzeri]|uniref:hypothetical protein n=1 Tax=Stutzerimonas stutzeri TaxID=316 RepID=UPI001909B42A|nr:hypothetical protein [Stutzerimonas stutzeri]MBK3869252.1 hypothetical protein [Stutzerimonas stutzeri]MBK3869296.1 hypothetical protein [Stutzerimonas stutzeri]